MPSASSHRRAPDHRNVVALAYDGLCTFEFGIVVEVFGLPRPEMKDWYRFTVCGADRGPLNAVGGLRVLTDQGLEALSRAGTIVIPGWRAPDEKPPDPLLEAVGRAQPRGGRVGPSFSGGRGPSPALVFG